MTPFSLTREHHAIEVRRSKYDVVALFG